MGTIRRPDPSPLGLAKQPPFSHQPQNPFVIDPDIFPLQLGGDPAIPVTTELFYQFLDPFDQGGIIKVLLPGFIVIAASGKVHELAPPLDTLDEGPVVGKE